MPLELTPPLSFVNVFFAILYFLSYEKSTSNLPLEVLFVFTENLLVIVPVQVPNRALLMFSTWIVPSVKISKQLSPAFPILLKSIFRVFVSFGLILFVNVTLLGTVTVSLRLLAQVSLTDTSPDSPGASVAETVTV